MKADGVNGDQTIAAVKLVYPGFEDLRWERMTENMSQVSRRVGKRMELGPPNRVIDINSPEWSKLHPTLQRNKRLLLGIGRTGRNKKTGEIWGRKKINHIIYLGALNAVNAAIYKAEEIGCRVGIVCGNRPPVSTSNRHAQRNAIGDAIDITLMRGRKRASSSDLAKVMNAARKAGATDLGFGLNNPAGSHIGWKPNEVGGLLAWNYDSGGTRAASLLGLNTKKHGRKRKSRHPIARRSSRGGRKAPNNAFLDS